MPVGGGATLGTSASGAVPPPRRVFGPGAKMAAAAGAAAGLWSEVNRCGQNGDFARALKSVNKSECGDSAGPRPAGLGSLPGRVGLAEGRCGAAGSAWCPSVGFVPGAGPRAKAAGILLCRTRGKRGGRGPGSAAVP